MKLVELGTILHMDKGKKPQKQQEKYKEGYLPYVDIQAFEEGIIKSYADPQKCLLCEDGDLLIVCDGSRSGLTGRAIKGVVGSTLSKISADGLCTEYLQYFIQSKYTLLNTRKKGTGTPHLNAELLKKSKLVIPTQTEQERIVSKEAFAGEYPRISLKEIAKPLSGYAFKSKKYSINGKYVVVKIGNVKPFHFDFSRDFTKTIEVDDAILSRYLLTRGDCLITMTGSRGKRDYGYVVMVEDQKNYLLNQRVAALRFNPSVALPKFFEYYLSSPQYRNQFFSYETGNVGQGNVGIKALTEPEVICPPIKIQEEIIQKIEFRLSLCDSIEQTIDTSLQQAEALRQSILKQAFEGRLI